MEEIVRRKNMSHMLFEKIWKIFRITKPKNFSEIELFENLLKTNHLIKSFVKTDLFYQLELTNGLRLVTRNYKFSDYEVFKQIFNFREYDVVLKIMDLNNYFPKKKIIIDAGANVGYTSIFFSKYLDTVKIFSVEPSSANLEIYKKNIELLETPEEFKIYHNALSEKSNSFFNIERNFRDKRDWAMTTLEDQTGEIKGITIDEIIEENNLEYVTLLKIDIEGAERFIFKKNNSFCFLQKTQIIAIEIHDEFQIREEIYDILRDNKFLLLETGEITIGLNKNYFF